MAKDMLAEVDTIVAPETTPVKPEPKLPTFEWKWWFKKYGRLDARPIIWSLYNKPQDWERVAPINDYPQRLRHKPSNHQFYFDTSFITQMYLVQANCGCVNQGKKFQRFQKRALKRAVNDWRAKDAAPIHKQFYSHFVY